MENSTPIPCSLLPITCNYHTHSNWCDGRDTPEAMVRAAIEKGFKVLGFSSHTMIPGHEMDWTLSAQTLPDYVAAIRALAKSFAPQIKILCGVEADYIPGGSTPDRAILNSSLLASHSSLDYVIGSVHSVVAEDGAQVCVDHTPQLLADGIRDHFGGSAEKFIRAYFAQQREMIERFDFDVVGHPDLVRKFMLDESSGSQSKKGVLAPYNYNSSLQLQDWYRKELELTADTLARSGKLTEVNTGAISRGWLDDAYPSPAFRAMLRERGVKFILSADAHAADAIDCAFDRFADAESFVEIRNFD